MSKTKHATELKTTYFEDDKIYLSVFLMNISLSFKPTFSGLPIVDTWVVVQYN